MGQDQTPRLSRRGFVQLSGAGVAALTIGCDGSGPTDGGTDAGPRDGGPAVDAGSDGGAPDAGPSYAPLAIPPLVPGELIDGVRVFNLEMRAGSVDFGFAAPTPTQGYNGDFLGPALSLRRGEDIEVRVTNHLAHVTTTHWHGMHVPALMDGGPHQRIDPDATWTARFTVMNPASLCWFHPHAMGDPSEPQSTSHQVYTGLAGLLLVHDDESDALDLPATYGVDDVPLVLQDRSFNDDGTFLDLDPDADGHSLRKGEHFLVNGVITPALETHAQLIRVRVLNGSNARIYNLALVDSADTPRTMAQIGSDCGLLAAPVDVDRVVLSPGERVELVLDLTADEGRTLRLVSKNEELDPNRYAGANLLDAADQRTNLLMTLQVGAATADAKTTLPTSLATIESIPQSEAARSRSFALGPLGPDGHTINGQVMDIARTDVAVTLGDTEIWEISNTTQLAHPFHIHGAPFQVLSRLYPGVTEVPEPERGWKDTVLVRPGERVRIIKRHRDYGDPSGHFMYHCHILEHEDRGMMGQFTVS